MKEYIISLVGQHGGIGVAIGLILEFIGFPVPGETMMTFLGYLSWKQSHTSFFFAIMWAVIGSNIGTIFAYFIGLIYGKGILVKYGKYIFITNEKLDKTIKLMNKDKVFLILVNRFIPGVRHVVPYLCGISKISFKSFIIYNLIGSIIWCLSFLSLGALLGDKWEAIEGLLRTYSVILIFAAILIFIIYKYLRKRK